jgi:hypothetical protein
MPKIKITNARLSFPSLFKKAVFDGVATKFEATFLLDKDEDKKQIKMIEDAAEAFLLEKFGAGKIPKGLKRTFMIDGDTKEYDGYENKIAFKGSSSKRITVINRDKTPIAEEDEIVYAGCYVNAIIDFWYSDHPKGGKQLLCNVLGVQFVADGEPFGAGGVDIDEDFDDIDDL